LPHRHASRARARSAEYEAYLQGPEWQERRHRALERDGYRCRLCNSADRLHVHHRTYERFGRENDGDLTTLCEDCHAFFHDRTRAADPHTLQFFLRDDFREEPWSTAFGKKIHALRVNVPEFEAAWARTDPRPRSAEQHELALCRVAVLCGWTDQDLCDLVMCYRIGGYGVRPSPAYIESTIRKARAGR
jgi:hypothetical protein